MTPEFLTTVGEGGSDASFGKVTPRAKRLSGLWQRTTIATHEALGVNIGWQCGKVTYIRINKTGQ